MKLVLAQGTEDAADEEVQDSSTSTTPLMRAASISALPATLDLAALASATGRFRHTECPPFDDGSPPAETAADFPDGFVIDRNRD